MAHHRVNNDCLTLMRQLARMAGIFEGGFKRMVLVLDIDDMPRLYTEGVLRTDADDPEAQSLEQSGVELQAEERHVEVEAVAPAIHVKIVDTTTQHNEKYRTMALIGPICPKCGSSRIIDASQSLDCVTCGHSW